MLLRYSPRGVESNALRMPATLIGSGQVCDIVIKSKDVEEKHALVEFHPLTNSYWLRFISSWPADQTFTHKHSTTEEDEVDELLGKGVTPAVSTLSRLKRNLSALGPTQQLVLRANTEVASLADQRYKPKPEKQRPEARQKALASAQQEILNCVIGAMLELRPADTIRFGSGEDAVEYVFEIPPITSKANQPYAKPNSSSTNSSSYSYSIMQRRSKKKKIRGKSASFEQKECLNDQLWGSQEGIVLPVVGNKVNPRVHSDRFTRPHIQTHNRRLCHISSESSLANGLPSLLNQPSSAPLIRNRSSSVQFSKALSKGKQYLAPLRMGKSKINANVEEVGEQRWPPLSNSPDYEENVNIEGKAGTSRQVGNQLLQRVIRLQAELQRKDAEISQLRDNVRIQLTSVDRAKWHSNSYSEALSRAQTENENFKACLESNTNQEEEKSKPINSKVDFTELICSIFFKVCYEELDALNNRVSNSSARNYADIFSETMKALQEPFSFRLMDINTKCSAAFENIKLGKTDRDQLYVQFDKFLKEKIYPISKAFDALLPILKDSASIARESLRACSVFSQWSREFGDQLQLQPSWELMAFKADDLQTRFCEWSMSKHWLPPSLLPLLKILIYEHKNQLEDQKRREAQYLSEKSKADAHIFELEELLKASSTKFGEIDRQKQEDTTVSESQGCQEPKINSVKLQQRVEELQEQLSSLSLLSLSSARANKEYAKVPQIHLQNSHESEEQVSLNKVPSIPNQVIVDNQELSEDYGKQNEEMPDAPSSPRRAYFAMESASEINETLPDQTETASNPFSLETHENQQRNNRETNGEDQLSQGDRLCLVDHNLVDSEEVDGMMQLKTSGSMDQERAASTHSKESIQAREEFYKDLQLGAQKFSFDEQMLGGKSPEGIDEGEEEERRSSSQSELNSSVEDSELPESRPLSQVQSNQGTPKPAPDEIEDIGNATPQDEDLNQDLELHSSDEEHISKHNFEEINKIYGELENRRKQGEFTNLVASEADGVVCVQHNSMHSQVSQSSVETVKEIVPEEWSNMDCTEDACYIVPSENLLEASLENSENIGSAFIDREESSLASATTAPQESPSSEKVDFDKMEQRKLSKTEDKLDECIRRKAQNSYETDFLLAQFPGNTKTISQHQNNAIQFWHLASLLAHMLRVDIPTHDSPDSLDPSLSTQNLEEIELRQTAVNTIIEKLELLLDNLRSSAGVGMPAVDSEDSGHCNSSSTTDGSKHELG